MTNAFSSIYQAIQGVLSSSFWFAAFLPVALFSVLHAAIAAYAYEEPITLFGYTLGFNRPLPPDTAVFPLLMVALALIVIGYALLLLMPRFRGWIDGSQLPGLLHDFLRARRRADARVARARIMAAAGEVESLRVLCEDAEKGDFFKQYQQATQRAAPAAGPRPQTLATAREAVGKLGKTLRAPRSAEFPGARKAVLAALADVRPNTAKGASPREREMYAIAEEYHRLAREAYQEGTYRHTALKSRHRLFDALDTPRATKVGDARFVTERYPADVYSVDFEFIWPRLLVAMKADKSNDPMLDAIDNARTKTDFAIMCLVLATTIPVVWLPIIYRRGGPEWLFFLIGAASPVVHNILYNLVFEAQLAFGDVVKTAIDRSRLQVLKMFRQPEPSSRSAERELWVRIQTAAQDARLSDLLYDPRTVAPPATVPSAPPS